MTTCKRCRVEMPVVNRFRFAAEPGDSARIREQLARFSAMGMKMGALVTVHQCPHCGSASAYFTYDDDPSA